MASPTLIRVPFYTNGGSEIIFGTKTDYTRYVVGVSVSCNKGTSKYLEPLNIFTYVSSVVSIFGEYNEYGAMLKNRGNSFNLPLEILNTNDGILYDVYFEVADNATLFVSGASSIAPFAGIVIYYEESTGAEDVVPL